MRKLAVVLAISLMFPAFSRAVDQATVYLSTPGIDKQTQVTITVPKGTAWDAGDLFSISFPAVESGSAQNQQMECSYSPEQYRRFNPGQSFWDRCKNNQFEGKHSKTYIASFDEKLDINYTKEMQDSWIPGFLMPVMPSGFESASMRISNLFSQITVNGVSCKIGKGCKIVSTATARQITFAIPRDVEMMKELAITIPSSFGVMCPQTPGTYELSVESKAKGSTKQEIVSPTLANPTIAINPAFPGEKAQWKLEFETSKAGRLDGGSSITMRMPKGFVSIQRNWPSFELELGGYRIDRNIVRMGQGTDFDIIVFPCPGTFEPKTRLSIDMTAINPGEGDLSCTVSTSSDTIPAVFGPVKIEFAKTTTSSDPTAGMPAAISARFKSNGHKKGDSLLAVLPSEIIKGCLASFNGMPVDNPTIGLRTIQFDIPVDIPEGAFCKLHMSSVVNPLENSSVKVSISNSSYDIPWNVTPYTPRLSVTAAPPIANNPCSYTFHITPPPDLLDIERKVISITGPFNKIIRPEAMNFPVLVNGELEQSEFNPSTNTLLVKLHVEFANMKPVVVTIPEQAGFGSPHTTSEFTVLIAGKKIMAVCKVQPAPPACSISVSAGPETGITDLNDRWFNEPVQIEVKTSSGQSDITVQGLDKPVSSTKSDLSFTIDRTIITEELRVSATDVGGTAILSIPPIRIDMEQLRLSVTNPFEKTGVSPTPTLIVGIETNRKIVPSSTMLMVIEPAIEIEVNGLVESSTRLDSRLTSIRPDEKMTTDIPVTLRQQSNSVKVTATDQTGKSVSKSFTVKLEVRNVALEFDASQSQAVDPGLSREISFRTEPETTVHIGEKTFKADMAGKVKATLDIVSGYNVFFTQLISKENVSYESQVFIYGRRTIRMKSEQKHMLVDGRKVDIKVPPTTITYKFKVSKGKDIVVPVAYAPLRALAENLFSTVSYDPKTQQITIVQKRPDKDRKILFKIGEPIALVDGSPYRINKDFDIPPIIKNGSAMIPMRFAAEKLGAGVGYDSKTKEIPITWPDIKTSGDAKPGTKKTP